MEIPDIPVFRPPKPIIMENAVKKDVIDEQDVKTLLERQVTALNYQTQALITIQKNVQFLAVIVGLMIAGALVLFVIAQDGNY